MSDDKVVSLSAKREKKAEEVASDKPQEGQAPAEASFAEIQAKNEANKKRIEKERLNANKSVLRSYRIKN